MGGSIYDLKFTGPGADEDSIRQVFLDVAGDDNVVIQRLGSVGDFRWSVRGSFQESDKVEEILAALDQLAPLDRNR